MDWGTCQNTRYRLSGMSMTQAPIEKRMKRIYSDKLWEEYVEKVEDDFRIKIYPQFDPYFDFPKDKEKIRHLVSDPTFKGLKSHNQVIEEVAKQENIEYIDQSARMTNKNKFFTDYCHLNKSGIEYFVAPIVETIIKNNPQVFFNGNTSGRSNNSYTQK